MSCRVRSFPQSILKGIPFFLIKFFKQPHQVVSRHTKIVEKKLCEEGNNSIEEQSPPGKTRHSICFFCSEIKSEYKEIFPQKRDILLISPVTLLARVKGRNVPQRS